MAQFDVHRNIGKQKDAISFVVLVQSSQFDDYRRRVVIPLVRKSAVGKLSHASSLSEEGQQIVATLDELFSRAWK